MLQAARASGHRFINFSVLSGLSSIISILSLYPAPSREHLTGPFEVLTSITQTQPAITLTLTTRTQHSKYLLLFTLYQNISVVLWIFYFTCIVKHFKSNDLFGIRFNWCFWFERKMTKIIEHEFYYVLEVVECRYRYYVFELVVIFPNLENCFGNFSHKSLN